MLDSFDGVGDSRAPLADADLSGGESVAVADFDPLMNRIVCRSRCAPSSEPADIYIDPSTRERLAEFCDVTGLSRARVIRVAVDRYLFDEITKTAASQPVSPRRGQSGESGSTDAR
ncbi:hypothetical protein ACW9HQ_52205, partial [Nocardia gipuzkoensis]